MRTVLSLFAAVLLAGCVFTPEVVTRYDEGCNIEFRHMTLTAHQTSLYLGPNEHCAGKDCLAALAATVMLTPASAIVSGSIVLAGNTLFWMEKQGQCRAASKQAAAEIPAS